MSTVYYSKNGGDIYAVLKADDAGYERQLDREGKNWDKLKVTDDPPVDGSKAVRPVEGKLQVVNR